MYFSFLHCLDTHTLQRPEARMLLKPGADHAWHGAKCDLEATSNSEIALQSCKLHAYFLLQPQPQPCTSRSGLLFRSCPQPITNLVPDSLLVSMSACIARAIASELCDVTFALAISVSMFEEVG
jgi:hypothetical protein